MRHLSAFLEAAAKSHNFRLMLSNNRVSRFAEQIRRSVQKLDFKAIVVQSFSKVSRLRAQALDTMKIFWTKISAHKPGFLLCFRWLQSATNRSAVIISDYHPRSGWLCRAKFYFVCFLSIFTDERMIPDRYWQGSPLKENDRPKETLLHC